METKLNNAIIDLFKLSRELDGTKPIPRNSDKISKLKVELTKQQAQVDHLRYLVEHPEMVVIDPFA